MSYIQLVESASEPSTPPAGKQKIFTTAANGPAVKKSNGTVETFKSLFGTNFASKKKTDDLVNTTTTFQNYDTLSLIGVPQGNYLIFVRYVWGYSSAANDIRVQCQLDGVNMFEEHRQEPKDGGADQRMHECIPTVLSLDGDHDITIDWASSNGGNQARMYESEFILFRID